MRNIQRKNKYQIQYYTKSNIFKCYVPVCVSFCCIFLICSCHHCTSGNATDPIWRVLASSDGFSSWTHLRPQHSNPNPLVNQLWCIDFFTPPTPLIIPHRLPAFLESLMPLKRSCSIHARWSKSSLKHSIRFCGIFFFSSLKQNFIAYRSSKVSDCIFEID